MLTRTLTTLALLLTFTAAAEPAPPKAVHRDRARTARHALIDDDLGGCRVPPPVPSAPAACTGEGQP